LVEACSGWSRAGALAVIDALSRRSPADGDEDLTAQTLGALGLPVTEPNEGPGRAVPARPAAGTDSEPA
jgi:hypothetical protein